jgi:hypothetical protein
MSGAAGAVAQAAAVAARSRLVRGARLRHWTLLGLLLGAGVPAPVLGAEGLAVQGSDRALLAIPAGVRVEPYANAGYRLEIRPDGHARVEVGTAVFASRAPFVMPVRPRDAAPRAALARALAAGASTRYQAVSRVLGWVSTNIAYELERNLPQDADSVLSRRSGYCTGIARLTVALLDELGIEAREVPGYVVAGSGAALDRGFHRWVEIYYPDRGWVFSDPLSTHHYVPATYLRLASEEIELGEETAGRVLWREDHVRAMDLFPGVAPGVRVRRNEDRQLASALHVLTGDDTASGVVTLEGQGVRWTRALAAGSTTFVGLEPGTYELQLRVGRELIQRSVTLPARVRQAVLVATSGGSRGPGDSREAPVARPDAAGRASAFEAGRGREPAGQRPQR